MDINDWLAPNDIAVVFCQECLRAADDPVAFAVFRQGKQMIGIVENKSPQDARISWYYTRAICPRLCEDKKFLRRLDHVGSPSGINIAHDLCLSPTTICNLGDLAAIIQCFGDLRGKSIIEIGGGYGTLCALINHFCQPSKYTIYDLPEVLALQRKFLAHAGIGNVEFKSEFDGKDKCNLAISNFALSELVAPLRNKYSRNVLQYASSGWIAWNYPPIVISSAPGALSWLQGAVKPGIQVHSASNVVEYDHPSAQSQFFWGDLLKH